MTKLTQLRLATILLMILSLTAFVACKSSSESEEVAPDASSEGSADSEAADEVDESFTYVLMKTSLGDMVIALNQEMAPISVENFLKYVDEEYYDGTIVHRVISTFMIQGGGFTADVQKKTTNPPITNEWRNGLKNMRGTLAMARLGGQPDSATSQFFVNVVDNGRLDQPQRDGAAYAVFGRVLAGMDVVDAIRDVPTHTFQNRMQNVPVDPVIIQSVRRLSADEVAQYTEGGG